MGLIMTRTTIAFLLSLVPAAFIYAKNPPAVIFPADNCAWTIEITYHGKTKSEKQGTQAQPRRVKIEAVCARDISHYSTEWSNKRITEDWLTGKFIFLQNETSGELSIVPNDGSIVKYEQFDQSRFDWVPTGEIKNERESYLGRTCIHVRKAMDGPPAPGEKSHVIYLQAWLDVQTHLPVAFDDGSTVYVYTFHPPPATPLTLPKQCLDAHAAYEQARIAPVRLGN